jgi:hypothetical protein
MDMVSKTFSEKGRERVVEREWLREGDEKE